MKCNSILETIGRTPLVRLNRVVPEGSAEVFCKLEAFNPMSSVKDRVAWAMIDDAERSGKLRPGMSVVEPTSGNTGIGLAMVCAVKGYRLILTMPESMSQERQRLLRAMGAEIVLTPRAEGMAGAIRCAQELCGKETNSFMPMQFENPSNPDIHERTTAQEILQDQPVVDAFVAGVGTGGTIMGVGRVLKRSRSSCLIVAVEPKGSSVLSGGSPGTHGIQGIGAGFIPKVLDRSILDRIIQVSDDEAKEMARRLAKEEGILAGISSGAAVHAAVLVAKELGPGKTVVTLLPDSGERYLSTDLFPK
jgi:cysteine synthase A